MTTWPKRPIEWTDGRNAYISVPFTWELPRTWSRCVWLHNQGYDVTVGGPAVRLMPDYLRDVATIGGDMLGVLQRFNAGAARTSTGCINQCSFCAVPITEGPLCELEDWEPGPVICDNNLTACSVRHFDRVIDRQMPIPGTDINQGIDARLLTTHHVERLRDIDLACLRISWDSIKSESAVMNALTKLADFPKRKLRVYVLVGWKDNLDDAIYRCESIKALGIRPFPMRFQPLTALKKNDYVGPGWDRQRLADFIHYWSRQRWLEHIPFAEYDRREYARLHKKRVEKLPEAKVQ